MLLFATPGDFSSLEIIKKLKFPLIKISSGLLTNIPLIASGGVGTLDHLAEGLKSGASAVLAASIFHFKTHSVQEAKQYLKSQNLAVRI